MIHCCSHILMFKNYSAIGYAQDQSWFPGHCWLVPRHRFLVGRGTEENYQAQYSSFYRYLSQGQGRGRGH